MPNPTPSPEATLARQTGHTMQALSAAIAAKRSFLCLGLDPELAKMPTHLQKGGAPAMLDFCMEIVQACLPYAVAVKVNTGFFEAEGSQGWAALEELSKELKKTGLLTIADAKRGDIGNTASQYAKAFFSTMDFDALTVNAYMGCDTLTPYLQHPGKHVFVLACTSNEGYGEFQGRMLETGRYLYDEIVVNTQMLPEAENIHYVAGATHPVQLATIRRSAPTSFLLVPGVGAQGGNLQDVARAGLIVPEVGLLVNASRSIIYASAGTDFPQKAAQEAAHLQNNMAKILLANGI